MKREFPTKLRRAALAVLLLTAVWAISGCSSDPENTSQRPWNTPEGWQNGNAGLFAQPH